MYFYISKYYYRFPKSVFLKLCHAEPQGSERAWKMLPFVVMLLISYKY